jgi:threonine/homoserine/homoserine lactone efflux protein
LGAAYLIYLGIRSLLCAMGGDYSQEADSFSRSRLSPRGALAQGFLSNLSNAKMIAFFISLLPPFAGPRPSFVLLLALGFNFCLLTLAWLVGYTFAVDRLGSWLKRSAVRRAIDGLLGVVLVGLGLRVSSQGLGST